MMAKMASGVRVGQIVELLPRRAQPEAVIPPEPSAMSVWMVCQPAPCASCQGTMKASSPLLPVAGGLGSARRKAATPPTKAPLKCRRRAPATKEDRRGGTHHDGGGAHVGLEDDQARHQRDEEAKGMTP